MRLQPAFATLLPAICVQFGIAEPARLLAAQEAREETELQLKGRIVDAESGEGVPDVVVRLFGRPDRHASGPDGTLSFDVPPGRYAFTAWKPGYATVESSLPVGIAGEFTVSMYRLDDVDPGVPARLVVRVGEYGSGRPIEGAVVSLQGGGARDTDARGMAEFRDLREAVAELSVGMIGYAERTEQVSLQLERTTVVQLVMTAEAIGLEPLEVEVRSRFLEARGVYWRIDHGRVQHLLTREHLDTLSSLSDALDRLPGMRVEYSGGLPYVTGRRRCPLRMFLDGFPLFLDSFDDLLPQEIEVIEVFLAERTPVRFGGIDNKCGSVVMWSRRKAGRGSRRGRYGPWTESARRSGGFVHGLLIDWAGTRR